MANFNKTVDIKQDNPIIGSAGHQFRVNHHWAKLPPHIKPGYTHAVVEDYLGRIYILNQSEHAVIRLTPDGQYIDSFGAQFAAGAHGLLLNREGNTEFLYFTDYEIKSMIKTTLDGHEIMRINQPDRPDLYDDDHLYMPTNTAVASNGDIYIADGYGQSYIHHYDQSGKYLQSFKTLDNDLGELNCPHGIAIDSRDGTEKLLVCDRRNERLVYFSHDGRTLSIVTENIRRPCSTIIRNDQLYIPDLFSRLTILDKNDHLITHLGERDHGWELDNWPNIPHSQRLEGQFTSPHDLHVDAKGNIYVVEWIEDGRITKLTRQ